MLFMNHGEGKRNWKERLEQYLSELLHRGVVRIGRMLWKEVLHRPIGNSSQSKPLPVLLVTNSGVSTEGLTYSLV